MTGCTLIVDASYCESGAAGWACWVKADGQDSHVQGGVITCVEVGSPNEAELVAMFHGLDVALQYAPDANLLLQSDSLHALRLVRAELGFGEAKPKAGANGAKVRLGDRASKPTGTEKRVLGAMRALLARRPAVVLVRHVKGHVAAGRGRHWCNARCDQLAKQYMREARGGAHRNTINQLADGVAAYRPDGAHADA